MKHDDDLAVEASLAARRAGDLGLTQSMIAEAVGASQSQVSRVLSGASARRSRLFDQICKYVFSVGVERPSVSQSLELTSAIEDVWDGSTGHAKALALVIRSLGSLRSASPGDRSSK